MRTFTCAVCGNLLIFENTVCIRCGTPQGFCAAEMKSVPLPADCGVPCANSAVIGCNWLTEASAPLCPSCRLTVTRPNDGDAAGMEAFARTEAAKRRLVYQLLDLHLPVVPKARYRGGLAFDLLSSSDGTVTTGHNDGLVTIDLAEGDDPHREAMRVEMGEPYRTLLGHLRHEVGHYYFQVMVAGRNPTPPEPGADADSRPWVSGANSHDGFRELFGDERADYAQALQRHYSQGPPQVWHEQYVSAYATAHPWEDWAETFAHYLHIRDTLQTASAYGMVVRGPKVPSRDLARELVSLPRDSGHTAAGFREMVSTWLPLTYALNAVNRSMGNDGLYPFVLAEPVIHKLVFVHTLVTGLPE